MAVNEAVSGTSAVTVEDADLEPLRELSQPRNTVLLAELKYFVCLT